MKSYLSALALGAALAVTASAAGRPIVSAAVSPRGDVLALADGHRVVFAAMTGRPAFALPIATRWIQWTR